MTGGELRKLRAALDDELAAAVDLRHRLHADPRVSGDEEATLSLMLDELAGGEHFERVAGTGGLVRVGGAGPAIALRAELDALPITERTSTPFAARGGVMHACGHDVHMAALVAVARAVRRTGSGVPLLALLQPREESYPSGARDVVASAAFAAHEVAAVIGAHVHPTLPMGAVSCTPGAVNAAADRFRVTMAGRPGHAAYPQDNRDAVLAIAQCVVSLQQLVSRDVDPMVPAVLTVGSLAAGEAANVMPETATALGVMRCMSTDQRALMRERIEAVAYGVACAHGCTASVEIIEGEPVLHNDPVLTDATADLLRAADLDVIDTLRSCGADDFAYFAAEYPAVMLFVGTHDGREQHSLHSPQYLPDDRAVGLVAAAMLAGYAAASGVLQKDV